MNSALEETQGLCGKGPVGAGGSLCHPLAPWRTLRGPGLRYLGGIVAEGVGPVVSASHINLGVCALQTGRGLAKP